jgi:hypothetical protein
MDNVYFQENFCNIIGNEEADISERIALAMYVRSKFPELTIKEVFQILEDPVFLVMLLETLKEVCND